MYYGGKGRTPGGWTRHCGRVRTKNHFPLTPSFKDKATSDYVSILVVGIIGARRFVLHIVNAHLNLDGTENEFAQRMRTSDRSARSD